MPRAHNQGLLHVHGGAVSHRPVGASTAPPYSNTIADTVFNLIHADDPDAVDSLTYVGFLEREMPADEVNESNPVHVFEVSFTDTSKTIELYMAGVNHPNPVDGSYYADQAAAQVDAEKYAPRLGKLPLVYRRNLSHVIGYAGDGVDHALEGLSAEDSGHFFVVYADRANTRIANNDLEESFFHEATHASIQTHGDIDGLTLDDYDVLNDPAWIAAVEADNAYITTYAMTDAQEDLAESALFAWAMTFHPERFPDADRTVIADRIPNRIAFFREFFAPRLLLPDGASTLLLPDGASRLLKALP